MFRLLNAFIHFPYYTIMELLHRLHDMLYYYKNTEFRKADLALFRAYLFRNPYLMCRRYLSSKKCIEPNKDKVQVIYGETLCMTFELLIAKLAITEHDIVFELGCGRGRGCFFIHAMTNAEVVGIELNPTFVKKANVIKDKLAITNMSFVQDNIFEADLSRATVMYFYGVAFSDTATIGLIEKFCQLPAGIRIICIGFSLNDYYDQPLFDEIDEFEVFFLWGKTQVYVCQTKGQDDIASLSDQVLQLLLQSVEN
mgnify:CR=1 FL=1